MKPYCIIWFGVLLAVLSASAGYAVTMSSPNYSITDANIVSGGGSATDANGMSKAGIAVGRMLYIPPSVTASSPNYSIKQVAQVSLGGGGGFLHTGDVNGDGVVDIVDALLSLKSGIGLISLSSDELTHGDVGPLLNRIPVGNGVVDIEDTTLILRKANGLDW